VENRPASENVVIQAPMSFAGSAGRVWKLTRVGNPALRWALAIPAALMLLVFAWFLVAGWYLLFGLLLVPYRLVRRGSRKRKRDALRHRELLESAARHAGR
jgi:hypothetical protein